MVVLVIICLTGGEPAWLYFLAAAALVPIAAMRLLRGAAERRLARSASLP
ncbi:hypothetical protein TP2_12830 [Thioclava pacifica DSM 10166]|uniref:Uncharacterized protein n=1 Tax=Thioclava pacifica DSM 10166 TaxID=1353537 RepID=A0A074J6N6_9RHOB|nr:hypothetical protein TP2_12830 [Thioclava pacifica DSM 10166]